MRLIDADKLEPDVFTKKGFAISQSQIANAPTITADKQTNTAEWISENGIKYCSNCKYEVWGSGLSVLPEWKFCPCCGMKIAE